MSRQALVVTAKGVAEVKSIPLPPLREDYINVRTVAVALNPTDWKHVEFIAEPGCLVGCDWAGVVEGVGGKVGKDKGFKVGDEVCGFIHGSNSGNHADGAFADHITAKADIAIKKPSNISFEEAATLGVGISTVGQGLNQSLGLPLPTNPSKEKFPILIYGGSTATGTLAIQFAKLSGFEVYTTCSAHNFSLMRSLGATPFDYSAPNCGANINATTSNTLAYVFDTISTGESAEICADALASSAPSGQKLQYSNLLGLKKIPREDVEVKSTVAYSIIGEAYTKLGTEKPAKPEDLAFGKMFWELSRKLLEEGKIKVHPVDTRPGGLEGVRSGLNDLKEGKVSGKKLVYRIG